MPSDFVKNIERMLDEHEAEDCYNSGNGSVVLYHGVSGYQRGGAALDKVVRIIDSGHLFPTGGRELDDIDKLKMAIVAHSDAKGIRSSARTIDEYVKQEGDSELLSQPAVRKYLDSNMKKAMRDYNLDIVEMEDWSRTYTNWFDEDETSTQETYGNEAYFEFNVPKDDVYRSFENASIARTHKPLSLNNAKRLVLGSKYETEAFEVKEKLRRNGFEHIIVEVGEQ